MRIWDLFSRSPGKWINAMIAYRTYDYGYRHKVSSMICCTSVLPRWLMELTTENIEKQALRLMLATKASKNTHI